MNQIKNLYAIIVVKIPCSTKRNLNWKQYNIILCMIFFETIFEFDNGSKQAASSSQFRYLLPDLCH